MTIFFLRIEINSLIKTWLLRITRKVSLQLIVQVLSSYFAASSPQIPQTPVVQSIHQALCNRYNIIFRY